MGPRILRFLAISYLSFYVVIFALFLYGNTITPKYSFNLFDVLGIFLPVFVCAVYLFGKPFPRYVPAAALCLVLYQVFPIIIMASPIWLKAGQLSIFAPMLALLFYLTGPWAYGGFNGRLAQ